jgi:hypothetical protein
MRSNWQDPEVKELLTGLAASSNCGELHMYIFRFSSHDRIGVGKAMVNTQQFTTDHNGFDGDALS